MERQGEVQPRPQGPMRESEASWQGLRQSLEDKIRSGSAPTANGAPGLSTMRASRGLQRVPSSDAFTNAAWAKAFSDMAPADGKRHRRGQGRQREAGGKEQGREAFEPSLATEAREALAREARDRDSARSTRRATTRRGPWQADAPEVAADLG